MSARWILTVSKLRVSFTAEKTKPGTPRATTKQNLLSFDSPRIMIEWLIGSLRIPIGIAVKTTAKPAGAVTATVNVILRIGGDIVWSQSTEVPVIGTEEEEKVKVANFILAADLVNPLILPQGKAFTIEATVSASVEADTLQAGLAEEITGTLFGLGFGNESQGAIAYSTRELTGHRVLS